MRIKIEIDSNEAESADLLTFAEAIVRIPFRQVLDFTYVTPVGAPIIYNPTVADSNGVFQTLPQSYTVQRHQCSNGGVNYIIPHVLINTPAPGFETPDTDPNQVQFFTQGLYSDGEAANLWYQTMSVLPPSNSSLPLRHRLIDEYLPAPSDPLPNVGQVAGSDVALAILRDIRVAIPDVGTVLFSWQVIDGIENLFLQQHA